MASFLTWLLALYIIFSYGKYTALCGTIPSSRDDEPALLIVSYDAFRTEYLQRGVTPFMHKFRKEGTSAEYMQNVFPTKTFPNHHTIATGHYPESHGVLGNDIYDSKLGKLGYGYDLFHYDESILPIWTLNEKAGKHSGCMMWPGTDFKYQDTSCTFTGYFNVSMTWFDRVDTVMKWFTHKATPANLVMLYIEEPDAHGHAYSPDSEVITDIVERLDNLTKYIQQKLVENKLDKRVNVIHLSDHGMNSVTPPNFIDLTKYLRNGTYSLYGSSPVVQVVPSNKATEVEIYTRLTLASKLNGHFKVYNNNNLPNRWRANNERRFGPILVVADVSYAFQDMFKTAEWYKKAYNITMTPTTKYGIHGYDNLESSMHAIFMAKGPLFASGKTLPSFNSVDLYNLFCIILQIEYHPNQGEDRSDIWDILLKRTPQLDSDLDTNKIDKSNEISLTLKDKLSKLPHTRN